jgi:hypothetical protein
MGLPTKFIDDQLKLKEKRTFHAPKCAAISTNDETEKVYSISHDRLPSLN